MIIDLALLLPDIIWYLPSILDTAFSLFRLRHMAVARSSLTGAPANDLHVCDRYV